MASPSNNRNSSARKTGGKAGGRAGRPSRPIAGAKDRTVRVPKAWNAQVMDPTNNRGGNQRPTGGKAGGRAGKPSGAIARPPAKAVTKPFGVPANYQMLTNPTQNRGAGQRQTGGQAGGRAGLPSGQIARPPATPPKPGLRARLGKAVDWVAGNTPEQQARVRKPNRLIDAITGDSPRSANPRVPIRGANALRGAARGIGPATLYGAAEAGRDALLRGAGMNDRQIRGVTALDRAITSGGASLVGDVRGAVRRLPQTPSGANSRRGAAPTPSRASAPKGEPVRSRFAGARDAAIAKARQIQGSPVMGPKQSQPASTPQRSSSTPMRGRGGATSGSTTTRTSTASTTSAPLPRRVSAATANRESGNYGTSRSDNKLLGDFIRQRMRQREGGDTNSIGPVKDGNTYAGNLNAPTGRGPVSNANEYGNMLKIDKMKSEQKKKRK